MAIDKKKIGNRIRLLRKSKDLSTKEFAKECGILVTRIFNIEKGTVEPTLLDYIKIANFFDITPDMLLYDYVIKNRTMVENMLEQDISKLSKNAPLFKKNLVNVLQGRDSYGNRI